MQTIISPLHPIDIQYNSCLHLNCYAAIHLLWSDLIVKKNQTQRLQWKFAPLKVNIHKIASKQQNIRWQKLAKAQTASNWDHQTSHCCIIEVFPKKYNSNICILWLGEGKAYITTDCHGQSFFKYGERDPSSSLCGGDNAWLLGCCSYDVCLACRTIAG